MSCNDLRNKTIDFVTALIELDTRCDNYLFQSLLIALQSSYGNELTVKFAAFLKSHKEQIQGRDETMLQQINIDPQLIALTPLLELISGTLWGSVGIENQTIIWEWLTALLVLAG
jgi:hypothetical protein